MSFWDAIKPNKVAPVATHVELSPNAQQLHLTWNNGEKSAATGLQLRALCPCAECVEEWSGKRVIDRSDIAPDISIVDVSRVGNYALSFKFKDGHHTGIYQWTYLREISQLVGEVR